MEKYNLLLTKYRFTLEAIDTIRLPVYKGSTFHGGFGHALMQISPTWYQYFFEATTKLNTANSKDWPKPFVILPSLDLTEHYPIGHHFYCELTLFGEARQHFSIAQAAIEYLGLQMGLGHEQGKYKIIDIEESSPEPISNVAHPTQILMSFPTRLRLKANNRLCRKAPEFELILSRLLGRIKTLQKAYMGTDLDEDYQHYILSKAKAINIKNNNTQWDDWDRFSGSQKQWMKFGGLVGNITYEGNLAPFIDTLRLGEWLHIGNKTSFGLGKYEITFRYKQ